MNTITRIAANIANRISSSSNTISNNVNPSLKEENTMNTNSIARKNMIARFTRNAAALLAFGGLLALSHTAKADVVVEKFEGPQNVYNDPNNYIAPGVTAMQLKVRNTFNYNVSNVPVQTYIYFAGDVNNGWQVRATPATTVSLMAGQSKWISILIPNTSLQGQNLRGQYLYAKALCNNREYWLNNFLDAAYTIAARETSARLNADNTYTFSIRFTNISHIASPAMNVTVNYAPYAGGDLGQKQPISAALPQLKPGDDTTLTFTTAPLISTAMDYVDSDLYIGTDLVVRQFRL